jgi:uncharacterized membrane protein
MTSGAGAYLALDLHAGLPVHPVWRQSRQHGGDYRNLMLTMLIGGLWHGAAWTLVFMGFLSWRTAGDPPRDVWALDKLPRLFRQLAMFSRQ